MTDTKDTILKKTSHRWTFFLLRAYAVLAILLLIRFIIPYVPAWVLYAAWSLLSIYAAVGSEYRVVINKLLQQHKYVEGELPAKINNGRTVSFVTYFVLAAFLTGSLFLEMTRWGIFEWGLALLAPLIFIGTYRIVDKRVSKGVESKYKASEAIRPTCIFVAIILAIIYLIGLSLLPASIGGTAQEAITASLNPLVNAPSVFLADLGQMLTVANGLSSYSVAVLSGMSVWVLIAIRIILCASAFLGISNLLGACLLRLPEMKSVFYPLEALKNPDGKYKVMYKCVILGILLPIVLFAGMLYVDSAYEKFSKTEQYKTVRAIVNEQVNEAVCKIDDRYFDKQTVKRLKENADEQAKAICAEYSEKAIPLIDEIYNKRIENVDAYLDWYYQPSRDYELLLQFLQQLSGKAVEDAMTEKFNTVIDSNIDTSKFDALNSEYSQKLSDAKQDFINKLDECELKDFAAASIADVESMDLESLIKPFDLPQQKISGYERLLGSAGVGAAAGIGAKIIVKPFFKSMVSKLAGTLGAKGLLTAGGAVVGNAVGIAAGIGVSVVVDFAVLKTDEAINRNNYKNEIIESINQSRAETIAALQQ